MKLESNSMDPQKTILLITIEPATTMGCKRTGELYSIITMVLPITNSELKEYYRRNVEKTYKFACFYAANLFICTIY